MRTNIDIDDALLKQAMRATDTGTKRAAVEACLRKFLEVNDREKALKREFQTREQQPRTGAFRANRSLAR